MDRDMVNPEDLDELHHEILDILREGRSTPSHLAGRTGESRQLVSQRLRDLVMADYVRKVDTGLYELQKDIDSTPPPTEFIVRDDQKVVSYGPSERLEDGWVLDVTTESGQHVDLHFPEESMHGLWVEVQGQPWPDTTIEQDNAAELRRELIDRSMGADEEMLGAALNSLTDAFTAEGGSLLEDCQDCSWSETWSGESADENPAIDHIAAHPEHTIQTRPADDE